MLKIPQCCGRIHGKIGTRSQKGTYTSMQIIVTVREIALSNRVPWRIPSQVRPSSNR